MDQNRKPEGVGVDGRNSRRRWNRRGRRKPVPYAVFIASTCVGIVVFVTICAVAFARFSQPYQHQAIQQKQIDKLKVQLDSDNASNAILQRHVDSLSSQEGIETAARQQRFVEPGEILLNVQASEASAPPVEDDSFGARLRRAWDGLTGR